MVQKKTLVVNGVPRMVVADGDDSLAKVLRSQLGLTGTKIGCAQGQCGCCSVLLDGKVVRSCVTKFKRLTDWAQITTIEGVHATEPARAAARLDGPRRRPVRVLLAGVHRLREGPAQHEPGADEG